ncbi:MAG: flavodoxin [archaeon]|nr:flavodoxin [archaeon]
MKTLVVYYSRTETTEKVAKMIKDELNCDIESIKPIKNYDGKLGYARGGFESSTKKLPGIENPEKDPSEYDLVIIGTPVWASTMASPVLTYLRQNNGKFNNVAFFDTAGGSGVESTFKKLEQETKKPLQTLGLTRADMKDYEEKTQKFVEDLKKLMN